MYYEHTPKSMRILYNGNEVAETVGDFFYGPIKVEEVSAMGRLAPERKANQTYIIRCTRGFGVGGGKYSIEDNDSGLSMAIDPIEVKKVAILREDGREEAAGYQLQFFMRPPEAKPVGAMAE